MKKLIRGIVEFQEKILPSYRKTFAKLALEQKPDALFVACSDSRVVPNLFASTDPGDLFVLRNIGNFVPAYSPDRSTTDCGAAVAALEFSVLQLGVGDIIVCGHSECGAMQALLKEKVQDHFPYLKEWLRHGQETLERLHQGHGLDASLSTVNQVSQLNVLAQMDHIKTYPFVRERIDEGTLTVHGWWFDIHHADVYAYEEDVGRFVRVDEGQAERMLARLEARR